MDIYKVENDFRKISETWGRPLNFLPVRDESD